MKSAIHNRKSKIDKHDLGDQFLEAWGRLVDTQGCDEVWRPRREYRFALPRGWRFDVAWPEMRLAVELEGGVWQQGRHTRPRGFIADCEKYNAAAVRGWRVLRYTTDDLAKRPVQVIEEVLSALAGSAIAIKDQATGTSDHE